MTEQRLAELEALANEATPEPWIWDGDECELRSPASIQAVLDGEWWNTGDAGVSVLPKNIAFIAAARTAVPELIAEVRRLRVGLESARATIQSMLNDLRVLQAIREGK